MRRSLFFFVLMIAVLALISCNDSKESAAADGEVELSYMFWGSLVEKAEIEKAVDKFNTQYEGKIHVLTQHVPDDYVNKLATMIAGGTAPDVCGLAAGNVSTYAQENRLLFLEDIPGLDKAFFDNIIPSAQWKVGGKVACLERSIETVLITYNRDIFDKHGVPYPPAKVEDALNWDEFVELCRRVTIDSDGNNALSPNFNPRNIVTYGLSLTPYFNFIIPFAASNGAFVLKEDNSDTDFANPAWIDTMNKINDLIHKYHVVPTPAEANGFAAESMLAEQVAMTCDGNWSLLDYQEQGLNVGCAVYPDLGNGVWSSDSAGLLCILADTPHPQEAWEFYKFFLDAELGPADCFKKGLWQPIYYQYYTDPEKVSFWVDTPAHPKEYRDVVIENIDRNIVLQPSAYIHRYGDVSNIFMPALQSVFADPGDTGPALREAQALITSTGAFKGRFD